MCVLPPSPPPVRLRLVANSREKQPPDIAATRADYEEMFSAEKY